MQQPLTSVANTHLEATGVMFTLTALTGRCYIWGMKDIEQTVR